MRCSVCTARRKTLLAHFELQKRRSRSASSPRRCSPPPLSTLCLLSFSDQLQERDISSAPPPLPTLNYRTPSLSAPDSLSRPPLEPSRPQASSHTSASLFFFFFLAVDDGETRRR